MNPVRSLAAILGGVLLFGLFDGLLESSVVHVLARGPIADATAYYAARNQPLALGAKLAYTPFIALLSGYTVAKVANWQELAHAMASAVILAVLIVLGAPMAAMAPSWARAVLVALVLLGMAGGGYIRGRAAQLESEALKR